MAKRKKKMNPKTIMEWVQVALSVIQGLRMLHVIPLLLICAFGAWFLFSKALNFTSHVPGAALRELAGGFNHTEKPLAAGEHGVVGGGNYSRYDAAGRLLGRTDFPPGSRADTDSTGKTKLIRRGLTFDPAIAMTYSGGGLRGAVGCRLLFWGRLEQEDLINDQKLFFGLSYAIKFPLLNNCSLGGGWSVPLPFITTKEVTGLYGSIKIYTGRLK